MSVSADYLLDRRRLSRQLTVWRAIAFGVAALALIALGLRFGGYRLGVGGDHVAKLRISGLITGDDATVAALREIGKSGARAVILDIDSPGGTTAGSERLYNEIRRLAAKKPTVAVVGALGASGAYITALAADRIFVRETSLVGSIGVLAQFPNVSGLLDKFGVKYETIKSSPLKAVPNGLEPTSDAARAAIAAVIDDSFAWFKALVRERRGMSDDELARVDDGRIFTGRQSLPLKLADAFGGEREAEAWLTANKGLPKDLPMRDYSPGSGLAGFTLKSLGGGPLSVLWRAFGGEGGSVDGLVSIWQMSAGN
ncbi:MAG: signal peptide peptidase SppA [Pseudomonadota bacterium]|nr:signal peptide peptidase SppA [Pseudomonadota bacterium]